MAHAALPFPLAHRPSVTLSLRHLAVAAAIGAALVLGGCQSDGADVTGSISAPKVALPADARAEVATAGERYRASPGDKTAALRYARALRKLTQYQQAEAVLEDAAIKAPYDAEILGAYGKALADTGKFKEASEVLTRAQNPQDPNWSIMSAQGSVADQLGDHAQAQAYYTTALKLQPNDPGVLTNLGLSYALSSKLPLAESTIRQAARQPGADMRVRQNLALVLALEGRFGEAQEVAETDLPPADAAASVASIKAMIAQSDTWREIQRGGAAPMRGSSKPRRLQAALQSE